MKKTIIVLAIFIVNTEEMHFSDAVKMQKLWQLSGRRNASKIGHSNYVQISTTKFES